MADDSGLAFAERADQRHHVSDGVEDAVGGDVGGRAAPPNPRMSGATT
jgi:hypothetical protein